MTPAQALATIRNQFYEASTAFVGDDEIRAYLWDAECDLGSTLHCNQVTTALTTSASVQEYSRPTGYEAIHRIQYSGVRLKKVDFRELEAQDSPGYSGSQYSGNPTSYYEWADKIGLWPIPTTAATVNVWGVAQPAVITSSSTAFSIPVQFTPYLADYALYRMYLKDQDDGRADVHEKLWEDNKAKALRMWYKRRYTDRFPTVKTEEVYQYTQMGIV